MSPDNGKVSPEEIKDNDEYAHDESTDAITQQLRALYKSVEDEGIPERFLDLLEMLDKAETGAAKDDRK